MRTGGSWLRPSALLPTRLTARGRAAAHAPPSPAAQRDGPRRPRSTLPQRHRPFAWAADDFTHPPARRRAIDRTRSRPAREIAAPSPLGRGQQQAARPPRPRGALTYRRHLPPCRTIHATGIPGHGCRPGRGAACTLFARSRDGDIVNTGLFPGTEKYARLPRFLPEFRGVVAAVLGGDARHAWRRGGAVSSQLSSCATAVLSRSQLTGR